MRVICGLFGLLYLGALGLLAIGTFGLFGQEQDPLSGVFLIPLGMPWIWLADKVGLGGALVAILAPLINLLILFALCRMLTRRRAAKRETAAL
jgi:hypothetical protein